MTVNSKSIVEKLTEFTKILDVLVNIEIDINNEDKIILLLCALPRFFEHFKYNMFYDKENTVTYDEVQLALRMKELTKLKDLKFDESVDYLSVSRGISDIRGNRTKSKDGDNSKYKCFKCHKTAHFKKVCSM